MEFHTNRPFYIDYGLMTVGTALLAFALSSIYDPIGLVTGGFTGIAILIKEITAVYFENGIPLWFTNIVLNIPVFMLVIKIKGIRYFRRTLFATAMLSIWLYLLPVYAPATDDLVLSALFGGVIAGMGIGMIFIAHSTTGGTDLVAALIQHYLKQYSIVQIMQVLDGIIVVAGVWIFGVSPALYAIIAIAVTSYVSDRLLEGAKFAKVAYIITNKKNQVADAILNTLGRGLTGWAAEGLYTGEHRNLLFCVVSKKEIVDLKEIVAEIDNEAFIVVSDVREVLGEGFLERKA